MERKDAMEAEVADLERQIDSTSAEFRREQRDASRRLAEAADSIRDKQAQGEDPLLEGLDPQPLAGNRAGVRGRDRQRHRRPAGEAAGGRAGGRGGGRRQHGRGARPDARPDAGPGVAGAPHLAGGRAGRCRRAVRGPGRSGGPERAAFRGSERAGRRSSRTAMRRRASPMASPASAIRSATRSGAGGWGDRRPGSWFDTRDIRQWQREFQERLADAQDIRRLLQQEGFSAEELDEIIQRMREFDDTRVYQRIEVLASLQTEILEELKRFEYRLRRENRRGERGSVPGRFRRRASRLPRPDRGSTTGRCRARISYPRTVPAVSHLQVIEAEPPGPAAASVILMHGLGADARDLYLPCRRRSACPPICTSATCSPARRACP